MRKIFVVTIIFLLMFLSVCMTSSINDDKPKNMLRYFGGHEHVFYSEDESFYYEFNKTIYKLDNANNTSKVYENCILVKDNGAIQKLDLTTYQKEVITYLQDENDVNKYKYIIDYSDYDCDGINTYMISYENSLIVENRLLEFLSNQTYNCSMPYQQYIINNKLYFTTINNYYSERDGIPGNKWNDNYISSYLYCIDLQDYSYKLIYSTDNQYTIIYGNENIVYLIDENNSIYCKDIQKDDLNLCYKTNYIGEISTEYCHDKIFVFADEIDIINVKKD